jgi:ParB/RepB/Spo0J family partition protein
MEKDKIVTTADDEKNITKKDYFMVDPKLIIPDEEFNVRTDYGDIDELKNSVIENGVKQPLRAFRDKADPTRFRITDGFRRMRAVRKALEEGHPIQKVPIILESKHYTNEQRILDMFIFNSGKKLTPLEEARLYTRLENFGWKRKDIARKIGKTEAHISNMINLSKAPAFIQNKVASNEMSATVAAEIARIKNEDIQKEIIADAVALAKSEGSDKIAPRHVKTISDARDNRKYSHVVTILNSMLESTGGESNERIETVQNIIGYLNQEIPMSKLIKYLKGQNF